MDQTNAGEKLPELLGCSVQQANEILDILRENGVSQTLAPEVLPAKGTGHLFRIQSEGSTFFIFLSSKYRVEKIRMESESGPLIFQLCY